MACKSRMRQDIKYRKISRGLCVTCCDLRIRCEWAFARLTPRRWEASEAVVEQQSSISMRRYAEQMYQYIK